MNATDTSKAKTRVIYLLTILVTVVVIIVLLVPSYSNDEFIEEEPAHPVETTEHTIGSITYETAKTAELSVNHPNVPFHNPAANTVDMVFTIIDSETEETIAITDKIAPGKYAYINLYEHFHTTGVHKVKVSITTFMPDKDLPNNGLDQDMVIHIIEN